MLGCIGMLLILGVMAGEVYSFVIASDLLRQHARDVIGGSSAIDTVLPIILVQIVLMVIGIAIVKRNFARLPIALMGSMLGQNNDGGRMMLSLIAGIFLIIPGFFLDVVAVFLLLPPIQSLLARIGQRVMMSLVKRQMAKMFPGGMPTGGFPGGAAGFPGMQPRGPLMPDERIPRRPGKVIDTTAERVDR